MMQRPLPPEPKNARDGYVPKRVSRELSDVINRFRRKEWQKERLKVIVYKLIFQLRRWLPLTAAALILVIWQAWALTQ